MANIATELDQLLTTEALPYDKSGCLCTAAQLLHDLSPSLILLTDGNGRLIGVEDVDLEPTQEEVQRIALQISSELLNKTLCTIEIENRRQPPQMAFGIRLTADTGGGFLGGVIRASKTALQQLESMNPMLTACGSIIWLALEAVKTGEQHERRARHLEAEQDTLKQAHADSVSALIEEREERIQHQRDHVIHLEQEVEKRSHELRDAMNQAKEATLAKSTFLANMSHEIRTPMTSILGFADVLYESGNIDQAPPDRLAAINTIRRNGKYLVELINDILDIAKIEAGKLYTERVPCSPALLIEETFELMHARANDKGLDLTVGVDGEIPEFIRSDPVRLRQILINLVGNAIKFTDKGGVRIIARHRIEGYTDLSMLEIDIVDTGIGLRGLQIAKLFQPFAQAGDSTSRRFGGTGLGLALSRRLARALGGDLRVTSLPGEGSTFRVTLATGSLDGISMQTEIAQPGAYDVLDNNAAQTPDAERSINYKVLLAEDGPDNQRLIKHILERAGANLIIVENGQQAIDAVLNSEQADAQSNAFDLILMDMQMPVVDGYAATTRLRKHGFKKPIIALTAYAMPSDRQKCLDAGCSDFVSKPIDRSKLIELIATWCNPDAPQPD